MSTDMVRASGLVPGAAKRVMQAGQQSMRKARGRQGGVEDILPEAANEALDHHDGEDAAHSGHPVGGGGGQGQGQQQAGDGGGKIRQGVGLAGQGAVEPFRDQAGRHRHHHQHQAAQAEEPYAGQQGGQQGHQHRAHQAAGVGAAVDVRGRCHNQFHAFWASFSRDLPARNRSTRGRLPGQT